MKSEILTANEKSINKLKTAQPFWVDVESANKVLGIDKHTLLHAGPPIEWEDMCGPMRGAVIAALKYESLAENDEEAITLAGSGKINFEPCHHHNAVGPMTGITSYSMPMICVENKENGNFSYSTFNEGAGDVLRFGAYGENTVRRLKWIENTLAPAMKKTVLEMGGVNLKVIIAQSLTRGDELHMRNNASSDAFIKTIIGTLVKVASDSPALCEITDFLTENNDQFFLNFAMAANKSAADAAHGIPYSTIVTAIARNGVEIGIRVSGLGNQWFTAPAEMVKGMYFTGYKPEDANPDIGDSAIMETGGLGGFAIASAPAIVRVLGAGTYRDAVNYTMDMYEITDSEYEHYAIPNLDFRGTPIGINIIKAVETGITPIINTAIAGKEAGIGMIGAGISKAPMKMFEQALFSFASHYGL